MGLRLESSTGNIVIANAGAIQGGAGAHAVVIQGGTANTLSNAAGGEIFTLGGVDDVAITAGAAAEAVTNLSGGWMLGSIDLDYSSTGGTSTST